MIMKRLLKWRRWKDPFRPHLEKYEQEQKEHLEDGSWDSDKYKDMEHKDLGPCIVTPGGVIPIRESNLPSKLYNMWVAHTNFDIEDTIQRKVSRIPGVIGFNPLDRYSFRIAIGRMFHGRSVRNAIKNLLCDKPPQPTENKEVTTTNLDRMIRLAKESFIFWAIIKDEKGKLVIKSGGTQEEVLRAVQDRKMEAKSWESYF